MRNIAIGLAAATIVIGDSTLTVSAGQESGIGKGSTGSVKSHHTGPRTYNQERACRNRFAELTPAHASVSGRSRANATATSPRANASNLQQVGANSTPNQRERIKAIMRERRAELTPPRRKRRYRPGPYVRR